MKSLTTPPRSLDLRAFGLVLTLCVAIAGGVAVFSDRGLAGSLIFGCLLGSPFALVAWLRPGMLRVVYAAWVGGGRLATRICRFYVLGVVFGIAWLVGLAGSRVRRRPTSEDDSGWLPRTAEWGTAYESQAHADLGIDERRHWAALVTAWSSRTRNGWVLALLPSLMLLAALDPSGKRSLSTSNYTLY